MNSRQLLNMLPFSIGLLCGQTFASKGCPDLVKSATQKEYPESKLSSCNKEKENGKTQYVVKVDTKDNRKIEADITPEGAILQTEEVITRDSVPSSVLSCFAAKYPKTKVESIERQAKADGAISYELTFKAKGKERAATFSQDGMLVEEE